MMKKTVLALTVAGLSMSGWQAAANTPDSGLLTASEMAPSVAADTEAQATTALAKLSYSLGVRVGELLRQDLETLDLAAFTQGVRDLFEQNALQYEREEMQQAVQQYRQQRLLAQQRQHEQLAQANLERGQHFLQENAQRSEVVTLASGLQYRVITAGSGARPSLTDQVKVRYRAWRLDGSEVDNAYAGEQPVVFRVEDVIPGWQEALQRMRVGATWELFVPPELAYGPGGAGPVGPNETLRFELELLEIVAAPRVAETHNAP